MIRCLERGGIGKAYAPLLTSILHSPSVGNRRHTHAFQRATRLPPLPAVASASPETRPLDAFKVAIAQRVVQAIPELDLEQVFAAIHYGGKGSDFTLAIPRFRLEDSPDDLCKKVIALFQADGWLSNISQRGSSLHFAIASHSLLTTVLSHIHETPEFHASNPHHTYGLNDSGTGKTVVIEFSSPNIAKPFHLGHLRSTILGQFLSNLYSLCGWKAISMNYLGDWGTQFGMLALGYEKFGSEELLKAEPIKHLYDVYVKITSAAETDAQVRAEAANHFRRMEEGNEKVLALWEKWRDLSVRQYTAQYSELNVRFDVYTGESQVEKRTIDAATHKLEDMGLVYDDNGAKLIDLERWGLGKPVLQKRDGTSIYLARDIGAAIERFERYAFDKMLYVVASQQKQHFAQVFKTLELLGYSWAKRLEHVDYGLVLGMSTRKGTSIFLEDIIKETTNVMYACMERTPEKYIKVKDPIATSREIGISAIKIQDMQAKRVHNYRFNWDRMTSFEGDTGPYIQYAHVRLCSIIRKNSALLPLPPPWEMDLSCVGHHPKAHGLTLLIGSFPDIVKSALKTHEPSVVVTYAMQLSHAIGGAIEAFGVKREMEAGSLAKARVYLTLFISVRVVLAACMRLLSLTPLERM